MLMDGAMGSRLLRLNLPCCEQANLTHPEEVVALHRGYRAAGAEVLLTNTFQANPIALAGCGLEDQLHRIAVTAQMLAWSTQPRFVLGDVGPIYSPGNFREFADRDALHLTLTALGEADTLDGILFETCSTPEALGAVEFALHQVEAVRDLPLLLSISYHRQPDGSLVSRSGHPPERFASLASRHGVAALGVNCGRDIGLDEILTIVHRYRQATDLPLFVRPNAGTPLASGVYPRTPEEFAACVPELLQAGVSLLGGCCGTTEVHIAAMRTALVNGTPRAPEKTNPTPEYAPPA